MAVTPSNRSVDSLDCQHLPPAGTQQHNRPSDYRACQYLRTCVLPPLIDTISGTHRANNTLVINHDYVLMGMDLKTDEEYAGMG